MLPTVDVYINRNPITDFFVCLAFFKQQMCEVHSGILFWLVWFFFNISTYFFHFVYLSCTYWLLQVCCCERTPACVSVAMWRHLCWVRSWEEKHRSCLADTASWFSKVVSAFNMDKWEFQWMYCPSILDVISLFALTFLFTLLKKKKMSLTTWPKLVSNSQANSWALPDVPLCPADQSL